MLNHSSPNSAANPKPVTIPQILAPSPLHTSLPIIIKANPSTVNPVKAPLACMATISLPAQTTLRSRQRLLPRQSTDTAVTCMVRQD